MRNACVQRVPPCSLLIAILAQEKGLVMTLPEDQLERRFALKKSSIGMKRAIMVICSRPRNLSTLNRQVRPCFTRTNRKSGPDPMATSWVLHRERDHAIREAARLHRVVFS